VTNGQRTQLRAGVPIVILVLGVVLIWWVWIVPRTPQFKRYKRKTETKAKLYVVDPPRGVRVVNVDAVELSSKDWIGLGTYSGLVECDAVIAYYKDQFPKHGLSLTAEEEDPEAPKTPHVCRSRLPGFSELQRPGATTDVYDLGLSETISLDCRGSLMIVMKLSRFAGVSDTRAPGTRGVRVLGWGEGARRRNPERAERVEGSPTFGQSITAIATSVLT